MKARIQSNGNLRSGFSSCRGSLRYSRIIRFICVGISVAFALASFSSALAENKDNSEYRVKLAFLYNFAQFVQWPADTFPNSTAPLTICVMGDNPFAGEIEQSLHGRAVGGHPLELRTLGPQVDPRTCQIVFVRATEMKSAARIFALLRGSSTLTVGEAMSFAARGGIINLTKEENKLRFEINIDAAGQTRLKISSKLLFLAKIVKD
jgi:hypothetical protein